MSERLSIYRYLKMVSSPHHHPSEKYTYEARKLTVKKKVRNLAFLWVARYHCDLVVLHRLISFRQRVKAMMFNSSHLLSHFLPVKSRMHTTGCPERE